MVFPDLDGIAMSFHSCRNAIDILKKEGGIVTVLVEGFAIMIHIYRYILIDIYPYTSQYIIHGFCGSIIV